MTAFFADLFWKSKPFWFHARADDFTVSCNKNMDEKQVTVLSLCDLSKAFDSICHDKLLLKLKMLNIDLLWFKSYPDGRIQSVHVGNIESGRLGVPYGVPQRSILGPILFSIFVNLYGE